MTRILIAVTHLLGVGHLARAAAIARALAAGGHAVTLVTGGRPTPLIATDGVRVVQLPPLHARGTDFTALRDETGEPASPELFASRQAIMLTTLAETPPDVVITELFPFGRRRLAGEFLALVEASRRLKPRPAILASVRDILVAPGKPERLAEAHERLERLYDGVLVHGDPDIAPLKASWPLDANLKPLLRYTGYVHDPGPGEASGGDGHDEIVVSAGGGAAGLPLYRAALEAAALMPKRRWRILAGGFDLSAKLPANVTVEPPRGDFHDLLSRCAVSVSQAGYNTVLDIVSARARAVVVPFDEGHETEQRARAERFAARGLLALLPANDLAPHSLAAAVRDALTKPRPAPAAIAMAGLAETVRLVEAFAGDRRETRRPLAPTIGVPVNARITDALDRIADSDRVIDLWWRDDDAVAPSPALDRLLALARRAGAPVAIATIPKGAEAALAERLAEEPLACLLVHGLSHANHAPAGAKKAEFGPHRPLEALRADAGEALRLTRERFARLCLPVFVPPWNRAAPELVAALPDLGYGGVSTAGRRSLAKPSPALAVANVHIDPIDWRGGRVLVGEDRIVAALLETLGARKGDESLGEPIGLLTHHLVHDEAIWAFCEALMEKLAGHPAVRLTHARDLFGRKDETRARRTGATVS